MKSNRYLVFMSMGFELVGLVLGALWVGQKMDQYFGTKGIMLIVMVFGCMTSWILHLVFLLKRIESLEEKDSSSN
jgi:F0F1-type ATP synthase assembly protein I